MTKPRLLIPVTYQFCVRYVLHTGLLDRLAATVQTVVALSWEDAALRRELEVAGAEVVLLPEVRFGAAYRRNRRVLDTWHLGRVGSPSTAIDRRRTERLLDPKLRRILKLRRLKHQTMLLVDRAGHVHYDDPWALRGDPKYSVPQRSDIEKLVSTLRYAAVQLSTSSTMTVDGAALDRPQVGLAYDDRPGGPFDRTVKELYQREHWLPIERSGGLTMAGNPDPMVDAIAGGLRDPGARTAHRQRMVDEIVTYTDGKATERLARGVGEWL